MNIRTIEDNFDYQAKEILQKIWDDYNEDCNLTDVNFESWLWENKEIIGEYFFERVDEYQGMSDIIQELNF